MMLCKFMQKSMTRLMSVNSYLSTVNEEKYLESAIEAKD